jgi:hypothetical protein
VIDMKKTIEGKAMHVMDIREEPSIIAEKCNSIKVLQELLKDD